jgi:hypothetical protein
MKLQTNPLALFSLLVFWVKLAQAGTQPVLVNSEALVEAAQRQDLHVVQVLLTEGVSV